MRLYSNLSDHKKGIFLAFMATICGSLVYLFSKAALLQVTLAQFGFYWFLFAIFFNVIMASHPKGGFNADVLRKKDYLHLLIIGMVELTATSFFYLAIDVTPNPAIPSFLRNLEYLFVVLLGFVLLSERLGRYATAGAVITLAGAFVVNGSNMSLSISPSATSWFMLAATGFYATRTILVKKYIAELSPVLLAINRALFLLIASLVYMLIEGYTWSIPLQPLAFIIGGAFVGPFLTSVFQYSALRFVEASRAAIIQSTTGVFVLAGALLMFGSLPSGIQIAGGIITITGIYLLMRK